MYPFERFSEDAKAVLTVAQKEAERSGLTYIGTEHLLLALLRQESEARRILLGLGVEIEAARRRIEAVLGRGERVRVKQIIPTTRVKKVIEIAFHAARDEGSSSVFPVHLLVALLEEGEGVAAHVLEEMGVTLDAVRAARVLTGDPGRPWPQPGARVLIHDPEPPYRLWEGVVTAHEDRVVTVSVPLHPARLEARAQPHDLHAIPLRDNPGCERCRFPSGEPA